MTGELIAVTFVLTPVIRLVKLVVAQEVNKFPAFNGTRRFIAVLTGPRQWTLRI